MEDRVNINVGFIKTLKNIMKMISALRPKDKEIQNLKHMLYTFGDGNASAIIEESYPFIMKYSEQIHNSTYKKNLLLKIDFMADYNSYKQELQQRGGKVAKVPVPLIITTIKDCWEEMKDKERKVFIDKIHDLLVYCSKYQYIKQNGYLPS